MPIPLVNSIASWFLKKRIHQMELFMKYPNEVQSELLRNLIATAKNTEVGKRYDFSTIHNYKTFAERVRWSANQSLLEMPVFVSERLVGARETCWGH